MAYLGDKALNIGNMPWGETSYLLLTRFAYIDIFGQVIAVDKGNREPIATRQWKEAFAHILQPRFLFPAKAALSDTEVFMRLARSDPMEYIAWARRLASATWPRTDVDLGFPGMLGRHLRVRAAVGTDCPIFHDEDASLDAQGRHHHGLRQRRRYRDGRSLPKLLGATVMFFLSGPSWPGLPCRLPCVGSTGAPACPRIVFGAAEASSCGGRAFAPSSRRSDLSARPSVRRPDPFGPCALPRPGGRRPRRSCLHDQRRRPGGQRRAAGAAGRSRGRQGHLLSEPPAASALLVAADAPRPRRIGRRLRRRASARRLSLADLGRQRAPPARTACPTSSRRAACSCPS